MTKEINTIGIYDVNEDVSGKFSTVYLRDLDDNYLFPPTKVKPSFGRKLQSHLDKVVYDDTDIEDGRLRTNIGVVAGVVVEDEDTKLSHVDWSTVNLNKMKPARVDLESTSVDFNAKGVYGSIASGHVRPIGTGDNVIVVSDGHEAFYPFDVHGDSSQFADTNLKLLVNPIAMDMLDAEDEYQIQHEFAKYGNSLLESSQKDHVEDLERLMDVYNHDLYSSDGIDELRNQPKMLGSIQDIVSDVRAYSKHQGKSIDDVLDKDGDIFQSVQAFVYTDDADEVIPTEKLVTSDSFADFVGKRQAERGINPVVFSNLTIEEIEPNESHLKIRNWDNAKINESASRKYAKDMKHVVDSNVAEDKRPYTIRTALERAGELEKESQKAKVADAVLEF